MFMRVYCRRCGGSFELYSRDDVTSRKARTCPHCQERVSPETWGKVVEAFDACRDACEALFSDSKSKTRFTVDYIDDTIYKNSRA